MFRWTGGSSAALRRKKLPKKILLSSDIDENKSVGINRKKEKHQKKEIELNHQSIDEITGIMNYSRIYAKKNEIVNIPQKKQIIEADVSIPQRTEKQSNEIEMLNDIQDDDFDISFDLSSDKRYENSDVIKNIIKVERKKKNNYKNPPSILVSKPNKKGVNFTTKTQEIFDIYPDRIDKITQI